MGSLCDQWDSRLVALPERQQFDIEGAAEYLGVSVNTAKHHVINGDLRYAIESFYFSSMKVVALEDLPKTTKGKLLDAKDKGWDSDEHSPALLKGKSLESVAWAKAPEHLYFSHRSIKESFWHENGELQGWLFSHLLEDANGSLVSLWKPSETQGQWHSAQCKVGQFSEWNKHIDNFDTDNPLYPCLLTLEELERFSGGSKGREIAQEPFVLPMKADDIAEAMCEYGNRYFREYGKTPTALELRGYMLTEGKEALQLSFDSREKEFSFGGTPLKERQFKESVSNYIVP